MMTFIAGLFALVFVCMIILPWLLLHGSQNRCDKMLDEANALLDRSDGLLNRSQETVAEYKELYQATFRCVTFYSDIAHELISILAQYELEVARLGVTVNIDGRDLVEIKADRCKFIGELSVKKVCATKEEECLK